MKKAEQAVLGTWRITGMEVWDADYFDMEVAAHVTMPGSLISVAWHVLSFPGRALMKTIR